MTFLILTSLLKIVGIVFLVILPMVSYAVYAERRVSALIQDRLGPNRVGPAGLFQPVADAMKFILKEDFTPAHVNTFYYWLAPCLAMVPAIMTIAVVPLSATSTSIGSPAGLYLSALLRRFSMSISSAIESAWTISDGRSIVSRISRSGWRWRRDSIAARTT